jgi:hypothetical protein
MVQSGCDVPVASAVLGITMDDQDETQGIAHRVPSAIEDTAFRPTKVPGLVRP